LYARRNSVQFKLHSYFDINIYFNVIVYMKYITRHVWKLTDICSFQIM